MGALGLYTGYARHLKLFEIMGRELPQVFPGAGKGFLFEGGFDSPEPQNFALHPKPSTLNPKPYTEKCCLPPCRRACESNRCTVAKGTRFSTLNSED